MTTWPPVPEAPRRCLAVGSLLLNAVVLSAMGGEPVVLADDLANPTAVSARAAADGGTRVLVAEAGAERLTEFNLLGENVFGREVAAPCPGIQVAGIAVIEQGRLVFGPVGVSALDSEGESAGASSLSVEPVVGPVAINDRWLFAPGERGLLRGRLAKGRVTRLRTLPSESAAPVAIAFSPEGYLTAITDGEAGEHRLAFYDPDEPAAPIAVYPLTGLTSPTAIAYTSGQAGDVALCVLETAAEGNVAGVYLVQIVIDGNRPAATATLATPITSPTSLAALPGGGLVVTTSDGERGSLLRLAVEP